ncbi:MAG: hypothetical protein AABZ64_03285, partial [Nitrospinota bacterium]
MPPRTVGAAVTQYLAEIRVTLEAFITFGVLWWTIRVFALEASRKEGLRHEEDNAHEQLGGLVSSNELYVGVGLL